MINQNDTQKKFSIDELCRALRERYNCIEIIYLFGSAKNGIVNIGSDIDVGVLLDSVALKINPIIGLEIEVFLQEFLNCSVDVVILNNANAILRYEILNTGKRTYEKNSRTRALSELCFIKDYFDVKYYQQKRNGYG